MSGKSMPGMSTYLQVIQPDRTLDVLARDIHGLVPMSTIFRRLICLRVEVITSLHNVTHDIYQDVGMGFPPGQRVFGVRVR